MARIRRIGLGLMGVIANAFKAEEVLPNEFSGLKTARKTNIDDFML